MATPFPFGSGNVLTAAQLNAVTTLPVSTKTASHTLTIADLGTRVVMNSSSATTITVNTSIFGASDKVEILNIGSGVCTVTAGTCTVGTTGTLALAQNAGGTLTFISASASVFTAGDVAASAGAFVRVGGGSVGTNTTVTFSNVFSSTYNNYLIIASDLLCGSSNANLSFTLSGITATYFTNVGLIQWGTGTITGIAEGNNSANSGVFSSADATSGSAFNLFMNSPNLAKAKSWAGFAMSPNGTYGRTGIVGKNSSTTQSTDFTLTCSSAFAGGRLDFYGFSLS